MQVPANLYLLLNCTGVSGRVSFFFLFLKAGNRLFCQRRHGTHRTTTPPKTSGSFFPLALVTCQNKHSLQPQHLGKQSTNPQYHLLRYQIQNTRDYISGGRSRLFPDDCSRFWHMRELCLALALAVLPYCWKPTPTF